MTKIEKIELIQNIYVSTINYDTCKVVFNLEPPVGDTKIQTK